MPSINSNWENEPAGSDSFSTADDELRGIKAILLAVLSKEHEIVRDEDIATGDSGTLRQGSGKAYYQDTPPAVRPDGSAFTDEDAGRMWYKTTWAAAGVNELGDGRFGWYILIKTATNTYRWLPAQGNEPIGTRAPFDESLQAWVNPTQATGWYTTGTKPGWIKCEGGGSYTRPQGSLTIPDDRGLVMRGVGDAETDGATGGDDEITIAKANLPPHGHTIDSDDFDVHVANHDSTDLPEGNGFGGVNIERITSFSGRRPAYKFNDATDDQYTKTPTLSHNVSIDNFPEATTVTDENDAVFDNDPLEVVPAHRKITWVLRIY